MAESFKNHLAVEIFSDENIVSYRNLARSMQVHVNASKRMLYEFHQNENKKRPGSVHATYLIAGIKKKIKKDLKNSDANYGNEPMPSSPPPFTSSMLEPSEHGSDAGMDERVPVKTIMLVREEMLELARAEFETITSIHIYSLSSTEQIDLATLTEPALRVFAVTTMRKEDPLIHNQTYGIIQNPDVRRRKGKKGLISEGPPPKFKPAKEETKPSIGPKVESESAKKADESSRSASISTTGASKPTGLKRDTSDIFKSFAKTKSKTNSKPALSRNDTDVSTNASASGTEDTKMTDAEEGESEDDSMFLDTGTQKSGTKKRPSEVKKEREDKAAKLRKMMDSDDDEKVVPNVEDASGVKTPASTTKAVEDEDVAWSDSDGEKSTASKRIEGKKDEEDIASEPKRRRGRRKVMKKRTAKDEDGYLVTKEEAVWESFSEDEPEKSQKKEPIKSSFPKPNASQTKNSNIQSKGGAKGGGAKGGNIMSFFGKK